ncbi:MAG: hypothetical protein QM750_19955 [Rubrivivax sp.]
MPLNPSDLLVPTVLCFTSLGFLGAVLTTAIGTGSSVIFLPMLLWLLPHLGVAVASVPATALGTSLAARCWPTSR